MTATRWYCKLCQNDWTTNEDGTGLCTMCQEQLEEDGRSVDEFKDEPLELYPFAGLVCDNCGTILGTADLVVRDYKSAYVYCSPVCYIEGHGGEWVYNYEYWEEMDDLEIDTHQKKYED